MLYPWIKYKYNKKKYFKSIETNILKQRQTKFRYDFDEIDDEFLNLVNQSGLHYREYYNRVVLYCGKESKTIKDYDMDQIELNNFRNSFLDTVDYYADVYII